MRKGLRVAMAIARRQIHETTISPAFHIAMTLGLLASSFIVNAFSVSIDTSGFAPALHPFYDTLARLLGGLFGDAFTAELFAEGPFLFALACGFLPMALFLSIGSVFRFGQEKSAGAIELLCYGPADGTSYLMASFFKDTFLSAVSLVVFTTFLFVATLVHNLVLGPMFLLALPVLFFLSLAVFAWGILCATLVPSAASAMALFLCTQSAFIFVLIASFSIASQTVRTAATAVAALLKWFSPFFYSSIYFGAARGGNPAGILGGIGLLLVLTAVLLVASSTLMKQRGTRA